MTIAHHRAAIRLVTISLDYIQCLSILRGGLGELLDFREPRFVLILHLYILHLLVSPLSLKFLPDVYCRLQRWVLWIQNSFNIFIKRFIPVSQSFCNILVNGALLVLEFLTVCRPLLQRRVVDRLTELVPHLRQLLILSLHYAFACEIVIRCRLKVAL